MLPRRPCRRPGCGRGRSPCTYSFFKEAWRSAALPGERWRQRSASRIQCFVPHADAITEDKYSYAPRMGEFKGVRTFAQQVKHVAAVNYAFGSAIVGEKPHVDTGGESGPDSIKTKADILKFLKESFVYLHK